MIPFLGLLNKLLQLASGNRKSMKKFSWMGKYEEDGGFSLIFFVY